ncbi:beta strand repeat-containing protein [Geminicoccus roseus]|uniref:beta strand repeat-containing protein n=1 Tax=Geminicoccus roseus TaxID=404900 RepID=UPI0003FE91CA|nr:calcium-binding protein [Geminicoccus roseus]
MAEILGTAGADVIMPTASDPALRTTGGDDVVHGLGGDDFVDGGDGDDALDGGDGDDVLYGGAGDDSASYAEATSGVTVDLAVPAAQETGAAGRDRLVSVEGLIGSSYNDTLAGDASLNRLVGGAGDDVLSGNGGNDELDGGLGTDTATYMSAPTAVIVDLRLNTTQETGGAGRNKLTSIEGLIGSVYHDVLYGDGKSNSLQGDAGDDVLSGGAGRDVLDGGAGSDTLDGGSGFDTATYALAPGAVTVDLSLAGVQATGGAGDDTLISIERLIGSDFADVLKGDAGTEALLGGSGDDVLEGGAGDDAMDGGAGSDIVSYASATSGITVDLALTGIVQRTGGAGEDRVFSIEGLVGSDFDDTLKGSSSANSLRGGAGDDVLDGGAGNDVLDGGDGTDTASYAGAISGVTVELGLATVQATGGAGTDTLLNVERLVGSDFADVLKGSVDSDVLVGGDGDDVLEGGAGNDTMDGGAGSDIVSYASATSSVTVDLALTGIVQRTGGAGEDRVFSIEGLVGSDFDDTLKGSSGTDLLSGSAGGDLLQGDAGDDVLSGGAGRDVLDGGAGSDTLDGGSGFDTATYALAPGAVTVDLSLAGVQATGGAGDDTLISIERLIGSDFADVLKGDAGTEALLGGSGDDVLEGGAGDDAMDGGAGSDIVSYASATSGITVDLALTGIVQRTGGAGEDRVFSIEGLVGSDFDDTLKGSSSANSLRGGAGDDVLDGGTGNDVLDGGDGTDTASYAGAISGVTVELGLATAQATGGAGTDTLLNVERLVGSGFADMLTGSAGDDQLLGGSGDDVLDGGAGADFLNGGDGTDTASYAGAISGVTVELGLATAQATGGAGTDTLLNVERLVGSGFADMLTGSAGDDVLRGEAGDDVLDGGAGNDVLDGGDGIDTASYAGAISGVTVELGLATAQATGGAGTDTLLNVERLVGSGFADMLTGSAGDDVLRGEAGDDVLDGGAGNDVLDGGDGTDTASYAGAISGVTVELGLATAQATGGAGTDTLLNVERLVGSGFADMLTGSAGDDQLLGGSGDDVLDGGAGADFLNGSQDRDLIWGDGGNDALHGEQGEDELHGGAGNDTLDGGEGSDLLMGDAGDDVLTGGAGSDTLEGGDGYDTADYSGEGGGILAWLVNGAGGAADDTLATIERVVGTSGDDEFYAFDLFNESGQYTISTDAVAFDGQDGNDQLVGGNGDDHLSGGEGDDVIQGGAGDDDIETGAGFDILFANLDVASGEFIGQDIIQDFDLASDGLSLSGFTQQGLQVYASEMFARLDTNQDLVVTSADDAVSLSTANEADALVIDVGQTLGHGSGLHTVTLVGVQALFSDNFYG